MFTDNHDSSFCFWVFEKSSTQKNCFLFCKKHGLFNSSAFQSRNFYCPDLQIFIVSVQGRQNLSISYLKQSCFGYGEGSVTDWTFHEKESWQKPKSLMKPGRNGKRNIWARERKKGNQWREGIDTWEQDLLIWAMFASSWQMAAKCVKKEI